MIIELFAELRDCLVADYTVKETGAPWRARICVGSEDVAEIRMLDDRTFLLVAKDGDEWALNARVYGEVRPFSMIVNRSKAHDARDAVAGTAVLTIRDRLFLHDGKFYMLGCAPEGRPLQDFLLGKRYICRLDGFPFSDLTQVDDETRSRLRRFRGVPVGELEGPGMGGYHVHLSDELDNVSLPLSASCYLLYSTP
jgi:hypothetical protein